MFMSNDVDFFIKASKNEKLRFLSLLKLIASYGFSYVKDGIDNILVNGDSDIYITGHYDVVNYEYCYLDNTVSLFIMCELKKKFSFLNLIFFNKEEPPYLGGGSRFYLAYAKDGGIYINLEVLGGGNNIAWCSRNENSIKFFKKYFDKLGVRYVVMPFSDGDILDNKFNVVTLASVNILDNNLDNSFWGYCHSSKDSINVISDDNIISNFNILCNVVECIRGKYA